MSKRKAKLTISQWMLGTEWGAGRALRILAGLTAMFIFIRTGSEVGADKYVPALRYYVDYKIEETAAPVQQSLYDILLYQATGRLNEIKKQLLDIQLLKARTNNRTDIIKLDFQLEELGKERDEIQRRIESIKAKSK